MFKRASLPAFALLAALTALPAASHAGGRTERDRAGAGVTRVFDDVGRGIRRVGEDITRAADRTLTAIFHDRRHAR